MVKNEKETQSNILILMTGSEFNFTHSDEFRAYDLYQISAVNKNFIVESADAPAVSQSDSAHGDIFHGF